MNTFTRHLILTLAVAVLASCTLKGSMRPTVNLSLDLPKPYTVQAWGYPSKSRDGSDAAYYSLSVSLAEARPFQFKFPDGHWAHSRKIDAATLATHLAPIIKDEKGSSVSRTTMTNGSSRYSIVFALDANGIAESMWLYACNSFQDSLLAGDDGLAKYSFPIKQHELRQLFGGPLKVGHDFVILGSACDAE